MRVAVIASMKGGLDHFVYRELATFAAQGLSIDLFPTKCQRGLYNPRKDWAVHRWHPLMALALQPLFFLRAPGRYLRLLAEAFASRTLVDLVVAWYFSGKMQDADVIYAICGDHKLFVGYFCKRILGKPLALTIHAYELYRNPNPAFFVRALAACDQVITVTEYNREILASRYGIDPARVEVVRCSVDMDDYRPAARFVILIVAFFDERKGHEVLFKAVKELAQDDIEIWVVGGENGRMGAVDVRGLARRMGMESQVAFFGSLNGTALKAAYRSCDVFCLPCHESSDGISEGFPTVLMEAMAFGKPVLTTRHVEIPRLVPEIVVDENDVEGLAEGIRRLYESASLRARLGGNNRRIAEKHFSTRNAERTARILRRVAGQCEG